MSEIHTCTCGNNTWFVDSSTIKCSVCNTVKQDVTISSQSDVIKAMGIPPSLPNALELAKAQLDRLKKKEEIVERIKKLIDLE
jgi:hypothetical protein